MKSASGKASIALSIRSKQHHCITGGNLPSAREGLQRVIDRSAADPPADQLAHLLKVVDQVAEIPHSNRAGARAAS